MRVDRSSKSEGGETGCAEVTPEPHDSQCLCAWYARGRWGCARYALRIGYRSKAQQEDQFELVDREGCN